MIQATAIGTNRYAPAGANAINLYDNGAGTGLTIAQLVVSVCMRAATACEAQSVVKMNMMTAGATKLDDGAKWMGRIADGSADWAAAKAFMTGELGIDAATLPDAIDSFDKRMAAVKAVKEKLDALAQQQQRDMIDLQTLVNRRDVAYSTSSNVVSSLSTSQQADATNF